MRYQRLRSTNGWEVISVKHGTTRADLLADVLSDDDNIMCDDDGRFTHCVGGYLVAEPGDTTADLHDTMIVVYDIDQIDPDDHHLIKAIEDSGNEYILETNSLLQTKTN